jgi:predicted dithiol-disulfide oxidoreductase (DUF899 family)
MMPGHRTRTREEWQAAREELAQLEAGQAQRNEEIRRKRLELPWVAVEKDYQFDTEDGKKGLAGLFEGRSQLLAYNIMFGPAYSRGACPGCTSLGDELGGTLVHLNHRDVTLICFSRAPIGRLLAYKQQMGWQFRYVSTYGTDFPYDFGLAMTEQQTQQVPGVKAMIDDPPEELQEWSTQIGAELRDGLREGPGWIAFARENATAYRTYTVMAPDPSSRPITPSCSSGRRRRAPARLASGARTNTRTELQGPAGRQLEIGDLTVLPPARPGVRPPAERSSRRHPAPAQTDTLCAGAGRKSILTRTIQNEHLWSARAQAPVTVRDDADHIRAAAPCCQRADFRWPPTILHPNSRDQEPQHDLGQHTDLLGKTWRRCGSTRTSTGRLRAG